VMPPLYSSVVFLVLLRFVYVVFNSRMYTVVRKNAPFTFDDNLRGVLGLFSGRTSENLGIKRERGAYLASVSRCWGIED